MACYDVDHDLGVDWNHAWKISTSVFTRRHYWLCPCSQDDEDTCSPVFRDDWIRSTRRRQSKVLNGTDNELDLVCGFIPSKDNATILCGNEATQSGALEALSNLAFYVSPWGPGDKPLTLLDIMENDTPHAEFAFLSVCHTAVGDEETLDEMIHLAAGLQFLSFKSVIGILWVVDDTAKQHAVKVFYEMFEWTV